MMQSLIVNFYSSVKPHPPTCSQTVCPSNPCNKSAHLSGFCKKDMTPSKLPPLNCILDENDPALCFENHVVFDQEMRVLGDCPLLLEPSRKVWVLYKGDCILSKTLQTIPCPESVFPAEVDMRLGEGTKFHYRGPCKYLDGHGIVPCFYARE